MRNFNNTAEFTNPLHTVIGSFLSIGFCCCYLFLCKSYRSRLAKRQPSKKVELSASGSVTTSLENSYVKGMHQFNYILRIVIYI